MSHTSAITKYREENGIDGKAMSLETFGKLFTPAVDKSTVMRWERGNITPRRAIEIEQVTGLKRHELLPEFFSVRDDRESKRAKRARSEVTA